MESLLELYLVLKTIENVRFKKKCLIENTDELRNYKCKIYFMFNKLSETHTD
jgi:hypothetical protein